MAPDAATLKRLLAGCWSDDTSSRWEEASPSRGQCGVTALVLHDHFGGEILKTRVGEAWHFYNRLGGARVDVTADQFAAPIAYLELVATREEAFADTSEPQYRGLSRSFAAALRMDLLERVSAVSAAVRHVAVVRDGQLHSMKPLRRAVDTEASAPGEPGIPGGASSLAITSVSLDRKGSSVKTNSQQIRTQVAEDYAERVAGPRGSRCGCGGVPASPTAIGAVAGYSAAEVATLPSDAVVNAFGCGNPTAFAGLRDGDTVLDLGSGAGIDLLLAATIVGPTGRVIGVDMTDAMIAKARANVAAAGALNVEVRKGIIEELPVESSSVDWVISNCVINLSPEKPRVFAEIARVLKPGGQMLVSDIVAHDLPPEVRALPKAYSFCVAGAISEEEYVAGLRAAGLADVEVRHRLVYDADQIAAWVASAVGNDAPLGAQGRAVANVAAGKVWSAKVYARRPR